MKFIRSGGIEAISIHLKSENVNERTEAAKIVFGLVREGTIIFSHLILGVYCKNSILFTGL